MFKITAGKGFFIQFANGYSLSVQFGYDNYCSNRWDKEFNPNNWAARERKLGEKGSNTAELAIRDPDGNFTEKELGILDSTDTVEGWATPERVLEVMNKVAALP